MKKDFLTLFDLNSEEILSLLKRGLELKQKQIQLNLLKGKTLGLIFEKESTRTRVSFEVAMNRLGGSAIYLGKQNSQLSRGESYADTARVLSRYLDAIVLRTFHQKDLEDLAQHSAVPVINGLTDSFHPCQLLADLMTVQENFEDLAQVKAVYVGDGNNMAHSWVNAARQLGFQLRLACPPGFEPVQEVMDKVEDKNQIQLTDNVKDAVQGAHVINTDTWFSMGQEVSDEKRKKFEPYQVNNSLLAQADPQAIVLHCLPAHRGEEITDEVLDGKQSRVFDQAENRLYAQMALLEKLMC